jgi:hypothetical protein
MEIPEKYLFSNRHKALLEKAREFGYDEFWKYSGIKDNTRCSFDICMENMFDFGVPRAFAGSADPMQDYLDLQLMSAVIDLASHCVRIGKLPLDTPGITAVNPGGEFHGVLIEPRALASVLETILKL